MSFNPLEFKHKIAGQPFRIARELVGPLGDLESESAKNWGLLSLATGAAYTGAMNLAAPFSLIQAGARGNRYFTGLSIGYSSLGYPMPLFNYITPGSPAEKFGAKLGGRIGAGVITHVPPFSWMDPSKSLMYTKKTWRAAGTKAGAKFGGRVAGRLVPGLGWGLLAYDVYDVAVNRSLWGFDLS